MEADHRTGRVREHRKLKTDPRLQPRSASERTTRRLREGSAELGAQGVEREIDVAVPRVETLKPTREKERSQLEAAREDTPRIGRASEERPVLVRREETR